MKDKANIAVLVSGGGTNLQALIDAQAAGIITSGKITMVVSNNPNAFALERAAKAGIETLVVQKIKEGAAPAEGAVPAHGQQEFEQKIIDALDAHDIDLIVLAGFMSILSKNFTDHFAERIINVHPSLIPSFCGEGFYGLRVHEAALAKGVKVTGATVHFVNEIPDGGKIILQKAVEVQEGDTPEVLQRRVMEEAEWILLPKAAEMVCHEIIR